MEYIEIPKLRSTTRFEINISVYLSFWIGSENLNMILDENGCYTVECL